MKIVDKFWQDWKDFNNEHFKNNVKPNTLFEKMIE